MGGKQRFQKNNKLAFEESVRAITSLYEGEWRDKQEVVVRERPRSNNDGTFSDVAPQLRKNSDGPL
jgi:hypothetical protein